MRSDVVVVLATLLRGEVLQLLVGTEVGELQVVALHLDVLLVLVAAPDEEGEETRHQEPEEDEDDERDASVAELQALTAVALLLLDASGGVDVSGATDLVGTEGESKLVRALADQTVVRRERAPDGGLVSGAVVADGLPAQRQGGHLATSVGLSSLVAVDDLGDSGGRHVAVGVRELGAVGAQPPRFAACSLDRLGRVEVVCSHLALRGNRIRVDIRARQFGGNDDVVTVHAAACRRLDVAPHDEKAELLPHDGRVGVRRVHALPSRAAAGVRSSTVALRRSRRSGPKQQHRGHRTHFVLLFLGLFPSRSLGTQKSTET
eukprot:Hpha_TRINITY_DN15740_c1_g1::TRINITY_DN15740_c1_g1_i1::g.37473::m.37473